MFTHKHVSPINGNTVVCFAIGAALGAALTLLYAPQSGEETRAMLADKTHDLKDRVGDMTDQVSEKAHQFADTSRDKIASWRGKTDGMRNEMSSAV